MRALLIASYDYLHRAGELMYGPLGETEKLVLVRLLERVDQFHTDHYNPYQADDFNTLYERLIRVVRTPTNPLP